jgi:FKBP-type peptidyl-prolyl cis-trans isomerase FkpA
MPRFFIPGGNVAIAAIFFSGLSYAQSDAPELKTEQDKLLYFMGTQLGESLIPMHLSDDELNLVIHGTRDAVRGDAVDLDPRVYGPQLTQLGEERHNALLREERPKAEAYLTHMAAKDGARTTESGLIYLPLKAGTGASPTLDSVIQLHFHGTLRDGTVIDSSVERAQPIQVPLKRVLPCWQEGFVLMQVGGKARLTCPAKLAYQDRGVGKIPPGAAITFEVELIKIIE